jgi:hypothetical protein
MFHSTPLAVALGLVITSTAAADVTGFAYQNGYSFSGTDLDGETVSGYVVDLYVEFDSSADTLLGIYDYSDITIDGEDSPTYHQGQTAQGWRPRPPVAGSTGTTDVSQWFDSFVSIGGGMGNFAQPFVSSVDLQPGFGIGNSVTGNDSANPGNSAGWYVNDGLGSPGALSTMDLGSTGFLVFFGRFSIQDSEGFSLAGSTGGAAFNQGFGTGQTDGLFTVVPTPGVLALFGIAGFARRRRS